jgi:type III restriction enzyme
MTPTYITKNWLYEKFNYGSEFGVFNNYKKIPSYIKDNLNPKFELRPYQIEAFARFSYYFEQYPEKKQPIHLLYNMATGSGKTLIIAGLILELYEKGYRNFLFFVNSTNIIEKTKDNFLNNLSNKFLFNQKVIINNKIIKLNPVDNFEGTNQESINICFTTIQKLHTDLCNPKENSITFEDFKNKKVVLLSDESHHGQVQTKQKTLFDKDEKENWENTVIKIFNKNKENLLLEFTATMDFRNKDVEQKYTDKLIYKYDLRQFKDDKYSKNVELLRSDTDKKGRILLALILNQYKQDIASKYGIDLKPVILFKAQQTIKQSEENKELFTKLIDNLSKKDLEEIKHKTNIKEIQRAFKFYEVQGTTLDMLVQRYKISFAENKCISVNEESEKEKNQLLINSLEDKDNKIRVIFAVQKLNEGWDVLNLYDIVRVYEGQSAGGSTKGGISPSTISEAQLIGRGARYCPFKIKDKDYDKYKRKFDDDLDNELRILEEIHFHSFNESRYISELTSALVNEGLMDDNTIEKLLKLKTEFKLTKFYKTGFIYLNEKIKNDYSDIKSFKDLGVYNKDYKLDLFSFKGKVTDVLTDVNYDNYNIQKDVKTIKLKDIPSHILKNALAKKEFFKYEIIRNYIPTITSINDIVTKDGFLSGISINFYGIKEDIENISNTEMYKATLKILDEIEGKIKSNIIDYKGSTLFKANKISEVFKDEIKIKLEKGSPREDGQESFVSNKEWYVYNANYGTSEEKACVELMDRLIKENFDKKYENIYFIRNELQFLIYNFEDGSAFSPDFVLFLKEKTGKELYYQIFIEPKGNQFKGADGTFKTGKEGWKEDSLIKIKDNVKLLKFIETPNYKIIGLPFYNQDDENKFKDELIGIL